MNQLSIFTVIAADGTEITSYPNVISVSEEQHGTVTIYQLSSDGVQRHATIPLPTGCRTEIKKEDHLTWQR